jgi:hypothetical protein
MEKYKETNQKSKKNYNSDKTFIQISKELHQRVKKHCDENNLKVKDFLERVIIENI